MRVKSTSFTVLYVAGLLQILAPSTGFAQAVTTFNPRVILEYVYSDNVTFVGSERIPDDGVRLQLDFPVQRTTKRSNFRFVYSPVFTKFSTFEELDNLGHKLDTSLDYTVSERSSWGLAASYRRTQVQADPDSTEDADLFLTPRDQRELLGGMVNFQHELSARWQGTIGVAASSSKFERIEDFEEDDGLFPREDKKELRGDIGINRAMSRKTRFGASYRFRSFEQETLTDETVHAVTLDLAHQPSPQWSLRFSIGPFSRERDVVIEEVDERTEGVFLDFGVTRQFRAYNLDFTARNYPSNGGSIPGTSTNSLVQLTLAPTTTGKLLWSAIARWARREPTIETESVIETAQIGGLFWYRFSKLFGTRFGLYYVDQSTDGAGSFTGFVFRGGIGLVWYPLAGTRFAPAQSSFP